MRITVTVPEEIGRDAERLAAEQGTSVSALYAKAVERCAVRVRAERAVERIARLIGTAAVAPDAAEDLGIWPGCGWSRSVLCRDGRSGYGVLHPPARGAPHGDRCVWADHRQAELGCGSFSPR